MRPDHTESWQPLASTLGFSSESEMLTHLYSQQGFSLVEMSKILGPSAWSIRRRLALLGVPLRSRGGAANRKGRRYLREVGDIELFETSAAKIALDQNVHISTVFAERKLRRRCSEILPNHPDPIHGSPSTNEPSSHDSGPVATEE